MVAVCDWGIRKLLLIAGMMFLWTHFTTKNRAKSERRHVPSSCVHHIAPLLLKTVKHKIISRMRLFLCLAVVSVVLGLFPGAVLAFVAPSGGR